MSRREVRELSCPERLHEITRDDSALSESCSCKITSETVDVDSSARCPQGIELI